VYRGNPDLLQCSDPSFDGQEVIAREHPAEVIRSLPQSAAVTLPQRSAANEALKQYLLLSYCSHRPDHYPFHTPFSQPFSGIHSWPGVVRADLRVLEDMEWLFLIFVAMSGAYLEIPGSGIFQHRACSM